MSTKREPATGVDWERNRRAWDAESDQYQRLHSRQLAAHPLAWGIWSIPESELHLIGDVGGKDVLEYGCGGAQWSIALANLGARVTALDNSAGQLRHARAAVKISGARVRLVHAAAERTPFADASFDVVFCDHGAMSCADPKTTLPEVARILRPGGFLAFSTEHPLHAACWDDAANAVSRQLNRAYFALRRIEDPIDASVNFIRPVGTWVALLLAGGFTLEALLEPRPKANATTTYTGYAPRAWARAFPAELMIRARKLQ